MLNYAYNVSIDNFPLISATGSACDISPLLRFAFWKPVDFMRNYSNFPSKSCEDRGRFVYMSENFGHYVTFKILADDTNQIIYRSNVRSAEDQLAPNLRIYPVTMPKFVKHKN